MIPATGVVIKTRRFLGGTPVFPAASVFEIEASRNADLPIRKFAGDEAITIWRRTQR